MQSHGLLMEGALQGSLPILGPSEQQERPEVQPLTEKRVFIDGSLAHLALHPRGIEKEREFQDYTALLDLIKSCSKQKDLLKGTRLHVDILKRGLLEKDTFIGTALLRMYAKCGALARAQELLDELPTRDVAAWNVLIAGYAQHGLGDEAFICYGRMRDEGISPDAITFVCVLKACGSIGATEKGEEIHAEVGRQGLLEKNIVVGTALVDMYAKCGDLGKAQEVFDELPERNVVSWNVLITGYAQQGLGDKAVNCFQWMQDEGLFPDVVTFVCILKACGTIGAAEKGREIHAEVSRQGLLKKNLVLGTALVDMYAKCGALAKAQEVFDELPARDVASWTALIAGYAQHGLGVEAVHYFGLMREDGLSPNVVTFACILQACGSIGAIEKGEEVHAEVSRQGLLEKSILLGNALVDMYAKCGVLAKAQEVFNDLPAQNVASWTALIAGYVQHGLDVEALNCFGRMREEGLSPDAVTFVCILKACGSTRASEKGEGIHAEVSRQGLLGTHIVLGNALIDMYAKCGVLAKSQQVFDELPARDVASWNALIAGYAQHGLGDEAVNCFEQMRDEGLSPDAVTFLCIFKACRSIGATDMGEEIHAEIRRQGLLEKCLVLGNGLVDMYAQCGALSRAQEVFDELPGRDVASWNALIAGYAQQGLGEEALNCLKRMREEGLSPDAVTFVCILKACGTIGAAEKGEEIHAEVDRQGLLETNTVLGNALVDMYAKCGALAKAQEVFDGLQSPDVASWNTLMAGYAEHGLGDETLNCFGLMEDEGFSPNAVTFVCVLKACASIGTTEKGEEVHAEVSRQGLLEKSSVLGNALVDMYASCGRLAKAQEVFNQLPVQDVVSWTALIDGYAQLGKVKNVFESFNKMIKEGIEPNVVTFVALLTACSHAGLVEEGQMYFSFMSTDYCIIPTIEHYTCMVDLFSRAGNFDHAISMIEKVPPSDALLVWSALLGACRKWGNVELGRWAFEHAVKLDEKYDAAYVSMCNIYAIAGMQDKAVKFEALRMSNGAWKIPAVVGGLI